MKQTHAQKLSDVADILQIPYSKLYKLKHRPEFQKSEMGYNVKRISKCLHELEELKEQEEKEKNLLGAEEELLEKQIKLETARHKCRLLELQIAQKEGNLIDVNFVLESRTKEISRMKKQFSEMINRLPVELKNTDETTIRTKLAERINAILADLAEFIVDDWNEEELNIETEIDE